MSKLTRRTFIAGVGASAASMLVSGGKRLQAQGGAPYPVYIARNGTPVSNVQEVVRLAGGIEQFIGYDDAVVLKPNGQWRNQGYTHTECMKALIDVILNRPGGFSGEVIIAEHVHRAPPPASDNALSGNYCWNMSTYNRVNNWSEMNYFELVADYHNRGIDRVTAIPLYDSGQSQDWESVSGPGNLSPGKHGWVRSTYVTANTNNRTVRLSHFILRSSFSGKLIDAGRNGGVWEEGGYNGQAVKLIILPTLNNHGGGGSEDYAGPTSALKSHIGIVEFAGSSGETLHNIGYSHGQPEALGESVGHLIEEIIHPTFYLTCAEYTGHRSRTDTNATHTKTVGLCADPVTLDYWMCKHVAYPIASQPLFNPDIDNKLRQTLLGCRSKGIGTINEAEMEVHLTDFNGQIDIALGAGWNWISTNIRPSDTSLDGFFAGILSYVEQVKTQTGSAVRLNGQWIGDLTDMSGIEQGEMYKVKVNQACALSVTGTTIDSGLPISLQTGWNWLAYFPGSAMGLNQALASILPQVQQVKSQTQSAIYTNGQWIGDLTEMAPGGGYTVHLNNPAVLTYPSI